MGKSSERKNEALKLHKKGMAPSKIAAKLEVSARTVQRWIRDEDPVEVRVSVMQADKDMTPSIPKNIADSCEKLDLTLSRRMAIRLLNLSEKALDAVEDCLGDPDARRADKLRAAKLVGDWLGLGSGARYPSGDFISIPGRVEQVFAVKLLPPPTRPPLLPRPSLFDEDE